VHRRYCLQKERSALPISTSGLLAEPGANVRNRGVDFEDCLKDGLSIRHRGNRNEWLYTLAEQAQIPKLPAPIEEGNREIEPSLLK
jgi:hypothetical protein